ncbi:prolyl 4-hydroxylase subunit alpha-1-like isoform X1 [Montipora foliosa]|uniref:prolyl 4-hydroxylase subunit alpha-1-like isoform X1 n=1 Tax=Montipora foliosa TaxID=591990 RepID=UPI0035F1A7BA
MTDLINLERSFSFLLDEYLQQSTYVSPPSEMTRFSNDVKHHLSCIKDENMEVFLGHPVNSYLLVRRFLRDWRDFVRELDETHPIGEELIELIKEHNDSFPTIEDLQGCAQAILRIQEVYHISAERIASGKLSSKTLSPEMSAVHCLELGLMKHHWEQYEEAYGWLAEAWKRMSPFEGSGGIITRDVLQYLIWAEYKTGRIEGALNHTNILIEEDPENEAHQQNKAYYENRLRMMQDGLYYEDDEDDDEEEDSSKKTNKPEPKADFTLHYEKLCRGQTVNKSQAEMDKLTCYFFNEHPLLLLKPAKIELANLKPNIYLIHDVIRDSDIEFIKELAMPRLQRATVTNRNTGRLEFADYRISKSAWLEDYEGEIIERLSLRLEAITRLSTARVHCEALQVVNYGIAGQYEPHVDHALSKKSVIFDMGMGNRIATVLIYMTDVEAGGSTVFLDAETIIKPQKGTAAFWFNLLKSGEPDQSTRHAACPVIVGTKWVSNKWIHEHGQEFRRKCGLSPDE